MKLTIKELKSIVKEAIQPPAPSETINVGNELKELSSKLRAKLVGRRIRVTRSGSQELRWGATGKVLDIELGSYEDGNVSLKLDSGTYILKVRNFKDLVLDVLD